MDYHIEQHSYPNQELAMIDAERQQTIENLHHDIGLLQDMVNYYGDDHHMLRNHMGMCGHLESEWLEECINTWEKQSTRGERGDFPIDDRNTYLTPMSQYIEARDAGTLWADTPYGDLRRELAAHLLDEFTNLLAEYYEGVL